MLFWHKELRSNPTGGQSVTEPGSLRLSSEAGRSLPAALIALAVGSLLLTPFLSFVSSRSLSIRAVDETLRSQYAADAGVEFGLWTVLNDPLFRAAADANPGTIYSLTTPEIVNGYLPTIDIAAVPIGTWYPRQFPPINIDQGGSLAYTGGDRVHALQGNRTRTFGYYSISQDRWYYLADTPGRVDEGGALTYAGGNYLYALQGRNRDGFWRYNLNTNTWTALEETPDRVRRGGALVYGGGNFLYAFRGANRADFWRYNISNDSWSSLSNAPAQVGEGAALVWIGGDYLYGLAGRNTTQFWRYSISGNTWINQQNTPGNVRRGGALAYYNGDNLYALQGNGTGFWRFNLTLGSWSILTNTPSQVGWGGSLQFIDEDSGFALRGGRNRDFWEFEVTPPQYDITSSAADVTISSRLEIDGGTNTVLFWDIQ